MWSIKGWEKEAHLGIDSKGLSFTKQGEWAGCHPEGGAREAVKGIKQERHRFFFKLISVAVTLPDENIRSLSFPITGNHAECFLSGHRAVLINQVKVAFDQTVLI